MTRKVLLVDDEPSVLAAYRRHLQGRFDVTTCAEPELALELLGREGPFGVVVSDYRMPRMNGVELLSEAQRQHPDVTRVMLTGQADYQATLAAINEGHIFRFLTKPCPPNALSATIADAIEVHELVVAEKELIEGTLRGAVAALTELLGLASPEALARADHLRSIAVPLAETLEAGPIWIVDMAASLSQIGCMMLADDVALAGLKGSTMSYEDREMYETHAKAAQRLLHKIPRLEAVAALVGAQFDRQLSDRVSARLHLDPLLADAFFASARFVERSVSTDVTRALADLGGGFSPRVVEALRSIVGGTRQREMRATSCSVEELITGMIARQDITTTGGVLLVSKGHEVTEVMLHRLRNFHRKAGIVEPLEMFAVLG